MPLNVKVNSGVKQRRELDFRAIGGRVARVHRERIAARLIHDLLHLRPADVVDVGIETRRLSSIRAFSPTS